MTATASDSIVRTRRSPILEEPGRGTSARLVVALHGAADTPRRMVQAARELDGGARIVAPLGLWGTYSGAMNIQAFSWFCELSDGAEPEPVGFGRGLHDVDSLLVELGQPATLMGIGQGATIALALARLAPSRLDAVVAIGGCRATLPPDTDPPGLRSSPPVLWLHDNAARLVQHAEEPTLRAEALLDLDEPLAAANLARARAWLNSHR